MFFRFFAVLVLFTMGQAAYAAKPWLEDECFTVTGTSGGTPPGYLCVEGISKLRSSVKEGFSLHSRLYHLSGQGEAVVVAQAELRVSDLDHLPLGRFDVITSAALVGEDQGYSIRLRLQLPSDDRYPALSSGGIKGPQGKEEVERYVWQRPPEGGFPGEGSVNCQHCH